MPEEAMWEFADEIRAHFPTFTLEDKAPEGGSIDTNSIHYLGRTMSHVNDTCTDGTIQILQGETQR